MIAGMIAGIIAYMRRRTLPKRSASQPPIQMPEMPPTSRIAPKYTEASSSVMPWLRTRNDGSQKNRP